MNRLQIARMGLGFAILTLSGCLGGGGGSSSTGSPTSAASTRNIVLNWTAPLGSITGYRIDQSSDGGGTYTTATTVSGTSTTATIALTTGATYTIRIVALSGQGESAPTVTTVSI